MSKTSLPILQLALRPGIIDLGWGHPDPALLPLEAIRHASNRALERLGLETLQYGHAAGPGPLLEYLMTWIESREGRVPADDEIMVTGGNSHGLDQLLTLCTTPGDTILVESPTYHLAVRILHDHPLNLVPVPTDQEGLNVDALAGMLEQLRLRGQTVRALYLVPTFNNPTGLSLSLARRQRLVELAAEAELLIIEDDVYRELVYDPPAPPSLWSMAPSGVVARLGSFSKSLAPGLRVGWLTAGRQVISRLTGGGMLDSGGGVNHFTALVVASLCESGDYDAQIARLRATYRERRDALVGALARELPPGRSFQAPRGGFFVWVALPNEVDAKSLLPRAEALGVSYLPGQVFYLDGRGQNALRLAFTLYSPDKLVEAAQRLGEALRGV